MKTDPRLPANPFSFFQKVGYHSFQVLDHFLTRRVVIKLFGKVRYKLFLQMTKSLIAKGEGKLLDVERRENISIGEFQKDYVKKGIPVVLSGAARDWACANTWSMQYFQELHGDDEVPLIDSADLDKGVEFIKLRELIDEIGKGNNQMYFRFYNLLTRHPEHIRDFDMNWLREHRHKKIYFESFQVFIGGAHSVTGIHNSHISNLFVQASGEKEWILYPNHYIPFIDPPSTLNGIYRNAPARSGGKPFNPFEPDYQGYPYFKYLDGYRVILRPGDILYNPPFMWHTVRNLSDSIGVGFRWINVFHSFRSSPVYYLLDLLAFKPNYLKSIRMTRKNANQQFIHRFERQKQKKKVVA